MENASKALIIAGSILISILIVSLGVLVFRNFSGTAKEAANMDEQKIAEFNAQITSYAGTAVSGSQVNALIQLVLSINTDCISRKDYSQAVTLNYNGRSEDGSAINLSIKANESTETLDRGGSVRRVPTGASRYYTVKYDFNDWGLINEINIVDK